MGSYVIRMKILPADPSTPLDTIVTSVKDAIPAGAEVRSHREEPIAFGLSALVFDIKAPEEEGWIERVEGAVSKAPLVGEYEVLGISRMSSRLPPQ